MSNSPIASIELFHVVLPPRREHKWTGATEAIDRIVEQGEGARGDWTAAHYGRFLGVLDDYLRFREERPDVDLVHPVAGAGVRAVEGMEPDVWITDRATAAVSDLFDAVYDLLLQLLVRWFAFGSETDEQLTVLGDVAVTLMFGAIEPLGFLLATLPVGPEHPAATAGAHFQLAYRANFLLPHRRAAWIRFTERLEEIADFAASVQASPDCRVVLDRVEASCRALGARLGSHMDDP